jgi:hypothetical protein
VGEGVKEQRCWVMEWGGQKWAGGVIVIVVGEGLSVGWLSEVREVGQGGVIIVIIRGGG